MILQTLYQQCVKRDVRFFNEFYCLDLLLTDDGRTAGVVAYELATGELHVFRAKSVLFATGGYGRMFRVSSNAHALTGDGLVGRVPTRDPARGHGVLPVPPDRPLPARRAPVRGRPRRGRGDPRTATANGSWSDTPRRSRTSPRATSSPARSIRRSRRVAASDRKATTSSWTSRIWTHGSSRRSSRTSPSSRASTCRSNRRRSRCRSSPRRTTRWVASRPTSHARVVVGADETRGAGPLRRGRVRVRLGPRREPARDELPARHRRLRPPGRRRHGEALRRDRPPRAPRGCDRPHARHARRDPHPADGRQRRRHPVGAAGFDVRPRVRGSDRGGPREDGRDRGLPPRALRRGSRSPTRAASTTPT